ncbi:MAG: exodeoxyribonuclease III [Mariniblastus sp.]
MKLVSWNVNGIRAASKKGFQEFVEAEQPDCICLQETKAHEDQLSLDWVHQLGYHTTFNSAVKKGYSGTAIWSKAEPEKVSLGLGIEEHDQEGRVITSTFDDFHLVTVYTPNSKRGLARLDYRKQWDECFLDYVSELNQSKPVIFCGDLNCAHKEIDLANPKTNRKNAGFTEEERSALDRMEAAGFVDSFREFDPSPEKYSWWTVRVNARERNIGWRLDYFWVAKQFWDRVESASIRDDVFGSDHCPVELVIS